MPEYNFEDTPTTLFQIWLRPQARGMSPHWEAKSISRNKNRAFASCRDARKTQDLARFPSIATPPFLAPVSAPDRRLQHVYWHRAGLPMSWADGGSVTINGVDAQSQDGVEVENESQIDITANQDIRIVLVDLALTE